MLASKVPRDQCAAASDSSMLWPGWLIVKAWIGERLVLTIAARTDDKSMPPERNAATGTSAIMWRLQVDWKIERICSIHSRSL